MLKAPGAELSQNNCGVVNEEKIFCSQHIYIYIYIYHINFVTRLQQSAQLVERFITNE